MAFNTFSVDHINCDPPTDDELTADFERMIGEGESDGNK